MKTAGGGSKQEVGRGSLSHDVDEELGARRGGVGEQRREDVEAIERQADRVGFALERSAIGQQRWGEEGPAGGGGYPPSTAKEAWMSTMCGSR